MRSKVRRTGKATLCRCRAAPQTSTDSNVNPTQPLRLDPSRQGRLIGHGFRNFDNYRLRLLLHCGVDWQTHQTTPLRGRLPRLAALSRIYITDRGLSRA